MLAERTVPASGAPSRPCSPGRAATAANACGRSRTAGTSPARSSASCSPTAKRSSASRPSSPFASAHRPRTRQVRRHRRRRDRPRGAARRPRHAARSRSSPGPSSTFACSSITANDSIAQRTALSNDLRWHLHDLWPETVIPPRALTATRLADAHRGAPGPRRADRARPHRPRRTAPRPRAHPHHQRPPSRTRRARRRARAAAARRTRLRRPHRRQAARRDRRRRPASPATPSSPAPPAPRPSPPPPGEPSATASTTAATARSTARCTASPSPKAAWTPRAPPTSPAAKPKARPAAKPSAASSATSPAASGTYSNPTPRPPSPPALQTAPHATITIHCNRPTGTPSVDIEATSVVETGRFGSFTAVECSPSNKCRGGRSGASRVGCRADEARFHLAPDVGPARRPVRKGRRIPRGGGTAGARCGGIRIDR